MADHAIKLREGRAPVPVGALVQPQPLRTWTNRTFKGATVETLSATLTKADRGDLEDWADFADHMLQLDPYLRAKYEERALAIVGAELEVEPGRGRPGEEDLAEEGAEFFRRELEQSRNVESTLTSLLHAEGIGYAGAQHDWQRSRGEWHSEPEPIDTRDIRFRSDWQTQVRTYADESGKPLGNGRWLDVEDMEAGRFMFHVPKKLAGRPHVGGDLRPLSWYFVFKKWAVLYMQEGLEKHGNPLVAGFIPEDAPAEVASEFNDALSKFTQSHAALFRVPNDGSGMERLKFFEAANKTGEAWREALRWYDDQVTIGLLGSALNTAVGETGGNRALGESQFDATILPRLHAMARRLASTLVQFWARPLFTFNAHLFGGRIPPLPVVRFKLVSDEQKPIPPEAVQAGLRVSHDEYRRSYGLVAEGSEFGGDDYVTPLPQPSAPAFDAAGGAAPRPFSRATPTRGQLSLPLTRRRTSATCSASTTRVGGVPFDR